jgi:hypothetical protein
MSALDFRKLMKIERESIFNRARKSTEMNSEGVLSRMEEDNRVPMAHGEEDSNFRRNDGDEEFATEKEVVLSNDKVVNTICASDFGGCQVPKWLRKDIDCHGVDDRIGDIENLLYLPDCIDGNSEIQLIELVHRLGSERNAWHQLRNRRLQCWGQFPELTLPIPQFFEGMIDELVDNGVFQDKMRPNNILINQYSDVDGVLHHTDGPKYEDKVAIISLGSDCIMSFRKKLSSLEIGHEYAGDVCSVVLRRRSLLIFEKDLYNHYMHGIEIDQNIQAVGEYRTCINRALAHVVDDNEQVSIHTLFYHAIVCDVTDHHLYR